MVRAMNGARLASLSLGLASVLAAAAFGACGGGGPGQGGGGSGGQTSTAPPLPTSICLLHNCAEDLECAACGDGMTTCLVAEHRCVACDAATGAGCPSGLVCSPYGSCAPASAACPTEGDLPSVTCATSADCAACDPLHQICEPVAHRCVACSAQDTSRCQTTETCYGGDCVPRCPAVCDSDDECALCGSAGGEAHRCQNHRCSACSAEAGCSGTSSCGDHGTCVDPCGAEGPEANTCTTDADCSTCGGAATKCNGVPPEGGRGTCGADSPGCDQIGQVAILPPPFDEAGTSCESDADCASANLDLDVGKLLRDLTGWTQIHEAHLTVPTAVCGTIAVTEADTGCGLCVPCRADADCHPLDVGSVADQAFAPLGPVAEAYLLDQLFGNGPRQIHTFCQAVAGSLGVCTPCPGLLNSCAVGTDPGDTGTACHDECSVGGPLGHQCGECATEVCKVDPYCCINTWDRNCVNEVAAHCTKACETCTDPAQGGHDKCDTGNTAPLAATCSPCVAAVCQTQPSCCAGTWDQSCIDLVPQYCKRAYLCAGQCNDPAQCYPQGCLASYHCGGCVHDYDCNAGQSCDEGSGDCF